MTCKFQMEGRKCKAENKMEAHTMLVQTILREKITTYVDPSVFKRSAFSSPTELKDWGSRYKQLACSPVFCLTVNPDFSVSGAACTFKSITCADPQTNCAKHIFAGVFGQFLAFFPPINNKLWYLIKAPCSFSVRTNLATINTVNHGHFENLWQGLLWKSLPALQYVPQRRSDVM